MTASPERTAELWQDEDWRALQSERIRDGLHRYHYGVRDYLHQMEAESGIPPELSARWDRTMEKFGL